MLYNEIINNICMMMFILYDINKVILLVVIIKVYNIY